MLHLVPQWQSAERHRKLKVMMQVSVPRGSRPAEAHVMLPRGALQKAHWGD